MPTPGLNRGVPNERDMATLPIRRFVAQGVGMCVTRGAASVMPRVPMPPARNGGSAAVRENAAMATSSIRSLTVASLFTGADRFLGAGPARGVERYPSCKRGGLAEIHPMTDRRRTIADDRWLMADG